MIPFLVIFLSILLAIYIWKDRKNIERWTVVFVRRTKKGISLLDTLAKIPGLKALYTLAIPICFFGSIFILFLISLNSLFILTTPTPTPGLAPIIPGVRIPGSPVFIPLWYGIGALAILLFVHEGSHGISSRVEKIKVSSTGLLLALVIPGAFVEPDKKKFESAKPASRLRVAAAGSFANFLTAILCVLLIGSLLSGVPLRGAILNTVLNETPAAATFNQTTIIETVNGQRVSTFFEIAEIIEGTKPNQSILFGTVELKDETVTRSTINLTTTEHPLDTGKAFVGIPVTGIVNPDTPAMLLSLPFQPIFIVKYVTPAYWNLSPSSWKWHLIFLLKWTAFLNFAIGMVNLLPLMPLDGGLMVQELIRKIRPKWEKKFMAAINIFIVLLFLINILPYFI